jgi:hypothetical protein
MYNFEELVHSYSLELLFISIVIITALTGVALRIKRPSKSTKKILFTGITASVLIPTIFLIVSTVYLNVISSSQGPVHWHADFEIWSCGRRLDLRDPVGLSNKIGTSTLHEHNDNRVHVEGVVINPHDVNLGRFFQVIGGELTPTSLRFPTVNGLASLDKSRRCARGSRLQVFVYKTNEDQYYYQQKLSDPQNYILSPSSNVPPGDCIIIEYDRQKSRTGKLCQSYKTAVQTGKLKGERIYGY